MVKNREKLSQSSLVVITLSLVSMGAPAEGQRGWRRKGSLAVALPRIPVPLACSTASPLHCFKLLPHVAAAAMLPCHSTSSHVTHHVPLSHVLCRTPHPAPNLPHLPPLAPLNRLPPTTISPPNSPRLGLRLAFPRTHSPSSPTSACALRPLYRCSQLALSTAACSAW